MRHLTLGLATIAGLGCSSTSTPPDDRISVGGTYRTAVTMVASTCPGQTVEQHPTTVTHTAGATSIALLHAGSSYLGTLRPDGTFETDPVNQVFTGITYRIAITGRFTTTSLDANVHVAAGQQPPCEFTARWFGPKDGAPNVIP